MAPDFVVPICLPLLDPDEEDYMNVTSKTLTRVAGWGATTERGTQSIGLSAEVTRSVKLSNSFHIKGGKPADTLQYLQVDVFDDEKCGEVYKSRGGVVTPGDQGCNSMDILN